MFGAKTRGERFRCRALPILLLPFAAYCSSGGSGGPIAPGPDPPAGNAVPVVTLSGETSVDADQPVTITVQANDPDGLTRVVIDWGDGSQDTFEVGGAANFQTAAAHTYARVGTFEVEATATDSRSGVGRATRSITTRGGSVEVGLSHAAGSAHLIARGTIRVGSVGFTVRDDGEITAINLVPGDHEVSAETSAPGCTIAGDPVQTVRIQAGVTSHVDFQLTCAFQAVERLLYQVERFVGTTQLFIDLHTVRPDGSDHRQLTSDGASNQFPAWSPDGTRIAWHSAAEGGPQIWVMNWDGSERTKLTEIPFSTYPTWSPDGRRIAFESAGGIRVMNHDGSDPRLLTQSGDASPAWSPDGTRIAFNRNGTIHLMASDGTGVAPLVAANGPMRWSPDGSRLTFTGFDGQVWTVAADGTDLRRITDLATDTGAPDYAPDGLAILFHSPRVSPEARIWIVNADGSGLRLLEGIAQAGAVHASWFAP